MAVTVKQIAKALSVSDRWVRVLFKRGMPNDLSDPQLIAKCKRWHASHVDSHRGGWNARGGGKRPEHDEGQDDLLRITLANLEEDLRKLRAENDAKEAGMVRSDMVARVLYDKVARLETALPILANELVATICEVIGHEDESVRKIVDERIRNAKASFTQFDICGKTVAQWAEEGKALKEKEAAGQSNRKTATNAAKAKAKPKKQRGT